MKHSILFILALAWATTASSQDKKSPLDFFDTFIEGKWEMSGAWANGKKFKQTNVFRWSLNKKIVKVQTFGTIDQKPGERGLRNEGIRAWDAQKKQIVFWEFDVYGGITRGTCTIEGKNIYYDYAYMGKTFRDSWVWVNHNKYKLKIGIYKDGVWGKVFLNAFYQRVQK